MTDLTAYDGGATTRDGERDATRDAAMNRRVENAIFRRACGYKVSLRKTYKVKRVEYDPTTGKKLAEVETLETGVDQVHVPADLRAGAYWLNNRDPHHWRDHPDEPTEGGDTPEGGVVEISTVTASEDPPAGEAV